MSNSDMSAKSSYLNLIKSHPGLIAIAFLAVFSGNIGQSFFIGLFQTAISEQLNISAGEFGQLYSLITLIGAFLVLYLGPKVDWVSPKRYAQLLLLAIFIGMTLLTTSPHWVLGVLGLGLIRLCGQGLLTHLGSTLAGREFDRDRGRALGLVGIAMPSGEIILPPLTALLLLWLEWQWVWWSIFLFILICWLGLFTKAAWPAAPHEHKASAKQHYQGKSPITEARFWLLIPMLLALPFTLTGIFVYQAQMTLQLNASLTTYALALTGMGLIRMPMALIGGHWIDELGVSTIARLYLLPFLSGLLIASLLGGNIGIWSLMIGAGLSMSLSSSVSDSLLVALWGKAQLGRIRSLRSSFLVFSTGICPALIGFLLDHNIQFQQILLGLSCYVFIACILAQAPINEASNSLNQNNK